MGAVAVQTIRAVHEFLVERDPKGSAGAVSFFFENKGWGRLGGRGRQDGAVSRAIARVHPAGRWQLATFLLRREDGASIGLPRLGRVRCLYSKGCCRT